MSYVQYNLTESLVGTFLPATYALNVLVSEQSDVSWPKMDLVNSPLTETLSGTSTGPLGWYRYLAGVFTEPFAAPPASFALRSGLRSGGAFSRRGLRTGGRL